MFQYLYVLSLLVFSFNLCKCVEDSWLSYEKTFTNGNREELVVRNVTSDENFKLDFNVKNWTTLSDGPVCYTAGLTDTKLVVLFTTLYQNSTRFNITSKTIDINESVTHLAWFRDWNNEQKDVLLVLATTENKILWYKIQGYDLVPIWEWQLDKVTHIARLNIYKLNNHNKLIISYKNHLDQAFVDIYEFSLRPIRNYWNPQSILLSSNTQYFAMSAFKFDYFLSVPQESTNQILIYKLNGNEFLPYENISAPGVTNVINFEIGFKSFLIIDGFNAGIYKFTSDGLIKQTTNFNCNGINYWLPVPVKTYRDEVILIVERSLDHSTHKTFDVDVITYNGIDFEEHEDIPCTVFGELQHGLKCLIENSQVGISGATYLAVDDSLGLLISSPEGSSDVFMIHSDIQSMPHPKANELQQLKLVKQRLQKLLDEQEHKREQVHFHHNSRMSSKSSSNKQDDAVDKLKNEVQDIVREVDEMKEKLHVLETTKFDRVTFNDKVNVQGQNEFENVQLKTIRGESASELLKDLVRKDNIGHISGHKTFMGLSVEHLSFEKVNSVPHNEILTNRSDITLNGNITFQLPVSANNVQITSGLVNNFDLKREIVQLNDTVDEHLSFKILEVQDTFNVDQVNGITPLTDSNNETQDAVFSNDVTVENLNGESFQNIIGNLCMVNVKCYVPHMKIKGNIIVNHDSFADHVNGVKFPEEYMLVDGTGIVNVTGRKSFTKIVAQNIAVAGHIDDVNPSHIVPLNPRQVYPGKIVFNDLEISEELRVTGKIKGGISDQFIPNDSLVDTKHIKSNIYFDKLIVEGKTHIENNLNGLRFDEALKDIVYKDNLEAEITAQKHFAESLSVRNNLHIYSNSVNSIPLDIFLTKSTEQELNIETINGSVSFGNLYIDGFFGGKNISELDRNIVRINRDHNISSTLIFNEEIRVEELEITEIVNNLTSEDFLYTSGDRTLPEGIQFGDIHVENIFVKGNFHGDIEGFDLHDFKDKTLSYSEDQILNGDFEIRKLTVDEIEPERINSMIFHDVFNKDDLNIKTENIIMQNGVHIKNLHINGSIQIIGINRHDMENSLNHNINLKCYKMGNKTELTVEGDAYFDSLNINTLSSAHFDDFVNSVIFKNETNIEVDASVIFSNGLNIEKIVETRKINNIPLENILRKDAEQKVRGSLIIHGNVTFGEDVEVSGTINDVCFDSIAEHINVSVEERTGIYNGEFVFKRLAHTEDLVVNGEINRENLKNLLPNLVYTDKDYTLEYGAIFENEATIQGNLAIRNRINNVDLEDYVDRIVWTTKDTAINEKVTFSNSVNIHNELNVDSDLITTLLLGEDIESKLQNAVYLNQGLLPGHFSFEQAQISGNLFTKYFNDINMSTLVPLKIPQRIDHLEFEKLFATENITVGNLVNGVNLQREYEKTVLSHLDQVISSKIVFLNNILVREQLISPNINNMNMSKLVTTNTDQNLTAAYSFGMNTAAYSNVQVYDNLNGVNLTNWTNKVFNVCSSEIQNVDEHWVIEKDLIFQQNVDGEGLINGLSLKQVSQDIESKKNKIYQTEKHIIDDYINMCKDMTYLYNAARSQIYRFKYFEEIQNIVLENTVQTAHQFIYNNSQFLLVNEDSCNSKLFRYQLDAFYRVGNVFETGHVLQVVSVLQNDSMFLVTRGDNLECNITGTNLWRLVEQQFQLILTLDEQELLQESLVPGTFYGLASDTVTEFKIDVLNEEIVKYRQWNVAKGKKTFVPRGLRTGLSLRTERNIVHLHREEPVDTSDDDNEVGAVILGETTEEINEFIPYNNGQNVAVLTVGVNSSRKSLLAVASHEETSVKDNLDLIQIYDPTSGEMFQKLPTYKASCLLNVDFHNGETLLVFMENQETLQVYEYKGMEGFRHRLSAKLPASQLILMSVPDKINKKDRTVIGVVNKNKIMIVEAVMIGNQINEDLRCEL